MYKIISDSSCDLSFEQIEKYNIEVVPFYVHLGDKEYQENVNLGIRDFYQFIVDHKDIFPKTSTPSIDDYVKVFTKYVKEGIDVLCICITAKFSGSYNSARLAREMVLEEYPDAKISVIDSEIDTVLQGTYTMEAAKLLQAGYSLEDATRRLEEIRSSGRIFFTVGSFDYLIHGGRIGKVAGVASNVLNIKPLIVLEDGEISAFGVARGRKKSMNKVIDKLVTHIRENNIDPTKSVFSVGYGYDIEEAKKFEQIVLDRLHSEFGDLDFELSFMQIGATICVHTGPYPIGVTILDKAL